MLAAVVFQRRRPFPAFMGMFMGIFMFMGMFLRLIVCSLPHHFEAHVEWYITCWWVCMRAATALERAVFTIRNILTLLGLSLEFMLTYDYENILIHSWNMADCMLTSRHVNMLAIALVQAPEAFGTPGNMKLLALRVTWSFWHSG